MKILFIALCLSSLAACQSGSVRTQHGWKTKHVEATRYQNELVGYNVGFTFPLNPNDCDREEIVNYIENNGGLIYEMGGYPGAPVYATFKGVIDRDTADKKLKQILPGFEKVVAKFSGGF